MAELSGNEARLGDLIGGVVSIQRLLIKTLESNGALQAGQFESVLASFIHGLPGEIASRDLYEPHRMLLAKLTDDQQPKRS